MSGLRLLWILGVFAATFVATILGYGVVAEGDDTPLLVFALVAASVPLLLVVHEAGHALAAVVVGYRVTGMGFTQWMDGWTQWEAPEGRETTARTLIAIAGGPVVTLVAAAALLLAGPFEGWLGSWRAGLGTFAILWTLDLLAPIDREGIARDGFALAEELAARRGQQGDHGHDMGAVIEAVDEALLRGDPYRARDICTKVFAAKGPELTPFAWAALAARLGLADLLFGGIQLITHEAARVVADASVYAPQDPVVFAVQAAIGGRLQHEPLEVRGLRQLASGEERLVKLADQLRSPAVLKPPKVG